MSMIFDPKIPLWGLYPQMRNREKKGPGPAMMQSHTGKGWTLSCEGAGRSGEEPPGGLDAELWRSGEEPPGGWTRSCGGAGRKPRGAGGPGSNSDAASPALVSLSVREGLDPHHKCVQGAWRTAPITGWGHPSGHHGLGCESGSRPGASLGCRAPALNGVVITARGWERGQGSGRRRWGGP